MDDLNTPARGIPSRKWWVAAGAVIGVAAITWVLWRIDFQRLGEVIAQAEIGFVLLVPLAIATEQLVRAWKWRQILHGIKAIGAVRLFGAIMAGYFANFLIPIGISPFVRSWLVARLEGLRMGAVLATAPIDRFVDGVVFSGFVAAALGFAAFPDPGGGIRLGLIAGGAGGLVLFSLLLAGLAYWKRTPGLGGGWSAGLIARLPGRLADPVSGFLGSFTDGIVWPREAGRGAGIIVASVGIKLIAATHFLWAGLAFGVLLRPADYIFLLVFLGFLVILTRIARVPGGFFVGNVFALDLLGVADEQALAMVLLVHVSTLGTISGVGATALWRNGIAIGELVSLKGGDG